MDNYNSTQFRILLEKNPQEFKEILKNDSKLIYVNLFEAIKDENIAEIVSFIKEDELHKDGNVLQNLLLLEPLSLPIINAFIESEFLDEVDFMKKIEISRNIASTILENLQTLKMKIRNDKSHTGITTENVNNLLKEVDKHKKELEILKTKKENNVKLKELKAEIAKIKKELDISTQKELEEQYKFYKEKKEEIKQLKEEIQESIKIFKDLPKDDA